MIHGTTFCQLFDNFLQLFATFWQLFDNFLTTFWQLFDNFLQLSDNFLTTFWQPLTTFWQLFWQLFDNFFFSFLTQCDTITHLWHHKSSSDPQMTAEGTVGAPTCYSNKIVTLLVPFSFLTTEEILVLGFTSGYSRFLLCLLISFNWMKLAI
jgi:hypothetical protein